jgi:hypothetical protein
LPDLPHTGPTTASVLVRLCFRVKTAKYLKKRLPNRKRNLAHQVQPKGADHSDKANSENKATMNEDKRAIK